MHKRHRISAALAAVVVAGTGAVTTATPAAAASSTAAIYITPSWDHPGYYVVAVTGHLHATVYATVSIALIGDDPVFNDDLGIRRTVSVHDEVFAMEALVWHGDLDEDWEGRDEVFAEVRSSTGWFYSTRNATGNF